MTITKEKQSFFNDVMVTEKFTALNQRANKATSQHNDVVTCVE